MPNTTRPTKGANQIIGVTLFHVQLIWLKEIKEFKLEAPLF
jgi:hypothetical protein